MLGSNHCWVYHYIFIISQLWLTSHPRSTVVLLETGTPGTSREIYDEDSDSETRTVGCIWIHSCPSGSLVRSLQIFFTFRLFHRL